MAATASRSPGARSAGSQQSRTTMSPLSQCLPTTRESAGVPTPSTSDERETSLQSYTAS